jgi:hypothetical protein
MRHGDLGEELADRRIRNAEVLPHVEVLRRMRSGYRHKALRKAGQSTGGMAERECGAPRTARPICGYLTCSRELVDGVSEHLHFGLVGGG